MNFLYDDLSENIIDYRNEARVVHTVWTALIYFKRLISGNVSTQTIIVLFRSLNMCMGYNTFGSGFSCINNFVNEKWMKSVPALVKSE